MREQLTARKLIAGEDLLETLLTRDEGLHDRRIMEDPRENVRLELLGWHMAHGDKNLRERHFSRRPLQRVGDQWPEERDGRHALRNSFEIARQSQESSLLPLI